MTTFRKIDGHGRSTLESGGIASSTMMAAQFLVREGDPVRFRAWLKDRSRAEAAQIVKLLTGEERR